MLFTDTTPDSGPDQQRPLYLLTEADSFYTLDPIATLLDQGDFSPGLSNSSGIDLAMSMVSLTMGALRYVRFAGLKNGQAVGYLVERDGMTTLRSSVAEIGEAIDMKTAMLASAAAPMFFAPQLIKGPNDAVAELYTDGGVRELVPVQAAIDMGADRVFALDCNAPYGVPGTSWPHPMPGTPTGIPGIALTVLGELLDEVGLDDTRPPDPAHVRFWHARPMFEIEGDMEIDPGAIRANIDYGRDCAFDAFDGAVRTDGRRRLLGLLGQRIAIARRNALDAERTLHWVVDAWAKNLAGKNADEIVQSLDYHRYPGDSDIGGRIANLMADMDVAMGVDFPNAHYLNELRSRHAGAAHTDGRQWRGAGAAPGVEGPDEGALSGTHDRRRGARRCRPDPDDPTQPDQPWLRYDQPPSQGFYGDLWPDGFSGSDFDPTTMIEVVGRQVEQRGSGGWALLGNGFLASQAGNAAQLLVPHGHTLSHLTGFWSPSAGVTWAPNAGATWSTTWAAQPDSPDLGGTVRAVTSCLIADRDTSALRVVARIAGDGGDTLVELVYDPQGGWTVLGPVTVNGTPLTDVIGNPVLIESSFAQEQAVELIVPLTDHVAHLHRSDPANRVVATRERRGLPVARPTAQWRQCAVAHGGHGRHLHPGQLRTPFQPRSGGGGRRYGGSAGNVTRAALLRREYRDVEQRRADRARGRRHHIHHRRPGHVPEQDRPAG